MWLHKKFKFTNLRVVPKSFSHTLGSGRAFDSFYHWIVQWQAFYYEKSENKIIYFYWGFLIL